MLRKAIAWPVAGLLAVGTIGMPAWAVSGADAAAPRPGPGAPGGQRGAGARASARGAEGSGPGLRLPVAIPRLSQGGTPEARALFEAARANDEAAFTAALAGVPHPGDYADDGRPLLHVLLMPPRARVQACLLGHAEGRSSAPARRAPRRAAGAHAHAGGAAGHQAGAQRCHVPVAPHGAATGAALWLAADRGHAAGGRRRSEPGRRRRTQAAGVPA